MAKRMAAPTNAASGKKVLADSEPSTHDPSRTRGSSLVPCKQSPEPHFAQSGINLGRGGRL
jgi:hypothetical protein